MKNVITSHASCQDATSFVALCSFLEDADSIDLDGRDAVAVAIYLGEFESIYDAHGLAARASDLPKILESFDDAFDGLHDSYYDFIFDLVQECVLPGRSANDIASRYFDYDMFGADLLISDYHAYYLVNDDADHEYVSHNDFRRGSDNSAGRGCYVFRCC